MSKSTFANNAEMTSCRTSKGGTQNICFYQSPTKGRLFCLGTSFGECPSFSDCKNEFEEKVEKSKDWKVTSISGRNTQNPNGGSSIPATKKCKMVAEQNDKQFNNIQKYINVRCGDSPMYLASRIKKEDGSYNNLQITEPMTINGKQVNVSGDMYMIWSALMKQSIDNEMENKSIQTRKIKGERDILESLKSQGVDLNKVNPQADINFSYTPPSKNNHDQAIFLVKDGPSSIQQIVVCPDQKEQGYQAFLDEFPIEVNIKECAESIYIGSGRSKLGMRSSMGLDIACFGKKDALYCVNADKCMNDGYSEQNFIFKTPNKSTAAPQSSVKKGGAIEN